MDKTAIYLVSGHGTEALTPFEKRGKVPKGCTLVLLTQCAVPLYTRRGCRVADFIRNPKNRRLLLHPDAEALSKHIGDVRVYKEGDRMPTLYTNLNLEYKNNHDDTIIHEKAWVYRAPNITTVDRRRFPLDTSNNKILAVEAYNPLTTRISSCYKYTVSIVPKGTDLDQALYDEIYRGAVFQPTLKDVLSHKMIRLGDLMKRLGEGVYYFSGCRSLAADIDKKEYQEMDRIIFKQEQKNAKERVKRQHEKMMRFIELTTDLAKKGANSDETREALKNFESKERPASSHSPKNVIYHNILGSIDKNRLDTHNVQFAREYKRILEKGTKGQNMSPEDRANAERLISVLSASIHPSIYQLFEKSDEQQKRNRRTRPSPSASA